MNMCKQQHLPILRRVGLVLIAAGLVDIAAMAFSVFNQIEYTSSLNVFAIIAGLFLWSGNLRAARAITLLSSFILSMQICLVVSTLLIEPIELTVAYLRLHQLPFIILSVAHGALILLLLWTTTTLTRPQVIDALKEAGIKLPSQKLPVVLGSAIAVLVVLITLSLTDVTIQHHAKELAEQQLGSDYNYHMTSYTKIYDGNETSIKAMITAWSDNDIKDISVSWQEK